MGAELFDEDHASRREQMFAKLEPLGTALHLLTQAVLLDLDPQARVLCVGVGTGPELFALAQTFPGWTFVAVDPAEPMLQRLRERVAREGLEDRCTIHHGYLDSLPPGEPFDAATCFLVSQFLTDLDARRGLFAQIAGRLRPGGLLVTADLTGDAAASAHQSRLASWERMFRLAEIPAADREQMLGALGAAVAVLPEEAITTLLTAAGFSRPVRFFQSLLIHGWYAERP